MREDVISYQTQVNGFPVTAVYSRQTVEEVLVPLLQKFTALWEERGRRIVIFLAAPPAAGKSTLALFLQHLSEMLPGVRPLQAVGLDGFHYPNRYLQTHTLLRDGAEVSLADVKGCAETFDVRALGGKLFALSRGDVRFPFYDRRIHDVVEDAVLVSRDILLLEGNWLLLDEPCWIALRPYADLAIFLSCREGPLRERLIERKVRGGMARRKAEAFFERCGKRAPGAHLPAAGRYHPFPCRGLFPHRRRGGCADIEAAGTALFLQTGYACNFSADGVSPACVNLPLPDTGQGASRSGKKKKAETFLSLPYAALGEAGRTHPSFPAGAC